MGYLPRNRFALNRIVPTEDDQIFRKQLVHGDVHDSGAALLGGVGGHAGLFANANDVGVFMQMLLQNGRYGGTQYLDSTILKQYTQCQFCDEANRRGAGLTGQKWITARTGLPANAYQGIAMAIPDLLAPWHGQTLKKI